VGRSDATSGFNLKKEDTMACDSCVCPETGEAHEEVYMITNDGSGVIDNGLDKVSCPDCREDNTVYDPEDSWFWGESTEDLEV
jgi:hypothetical protein